MSAEWTPEDYEDSLEGLQVQITGNLTAIEEVLSAVTVVSNDLIRFKRNVYGCLIAVAAVLLMLLL